MTKYLGQVLAIHDDIRKAATRKITEAYHALQKPDMLAGMFGEYAPYADGPEAEQLPDEEQRVQATVEEMIKATRGGLAPLFDVTAARDWTNGSGRAVADIEIDGVVLVEKAPVPFLLWLIKQLDDLETFIAKAPTHNPSTLWEHVEDRGVYKSLPVKRARSVQKHTVVTVAPATERHQAQAQIVAENVNVGTWTRVQFTGAIPAERRDHILGQIAKLRNAVEAARAVANRVDADEPEVGADLLGYLFD